MTWTFSGDPANSNLDHVRALIGDIDTTDQLVTDEIINFQLAQNADDVFLAAEAVCLGLAAKFARKVDTSVESVRVSYSNLYKQYIEMARRYKQQAASSSSSSGGGGVGVPFLAGISISQRDTLKDDTDLIQPRFERDQFDADSIYKNDEGKQRR
jgi:hypothetical protein